MTVFWLGAALMAGRVSTAGAQLHQRLRARSLRTSKRDRGPSRGLANPTSHVTTVQQSVTRFCTGQMVVRTVLEATKIEKVIWEVMI